METDPRPTGPGRASNPRAISPELCSRCRCRSTTPRGVPVEPEVYWRNATASALRPGSRHASASLAGTASVASQRSARRSDASSVSGSTISEMPDVVSATRAPQSATSAWSRGSVRPSRIGSGGYAGTATTPAYRHPRKPSTYSRPGGYSSSARSPGARCRCNSAATARAPASSSAYVRVLSPSSSRKVKTRSPPCAAARARQTSTKVACSGQTKSEAGSARVGRYMSDSRGGFQRRAPAITA